ncbi:hypothetical protein MNBD_GAMMA05-897 [hydrothermal vent metagenome]|uniref:DUF2232 domain-containing protein n=1 Tax=hydrothermal vent metagenome TaxID=652676 RepID=A0A3B0X3J7_9ZZZZ
MLYLARFILKGQSQAALVAATMAILGLILPPAAWISAAAIVLVTLVHDPKSGLITLALSSLGAAIFSYLIFATPQIAVMFVLLAWLPAWLMASILRQTVSLAYSLQILTIMGLFAVVVLYVLFPNFGEFWREPLDQIVVQLAQQSNDISLAELKQTENWVIEFLPGLFVSSIMFGSMVSLFLGRWWQAVYYNPGGFAKEFQSLNLGKISALIAITIMLIASLVNSVFMIALVTVVFVLYGMQALSLVHATINIRQVNSAWLVMIYLIMLFIPQVVLLLMFASFADPWLDIRQRIAKPV